ncbi:MAG: aldehyde dehydrogenase family protein [Planctomycetota bacterium]
MSIPDDDAKYAQYADEVLGTATAAAEAMRALDQAAVDRIVTAVCDAAFAARHDLAAQACEETGIGVVAHKAIKNAWASLAVWRDIIQQPTVGVIREDIDRGLLEIAEPRGPVLAFTPMTNPTSTVIFKALVALKTRNPLIFSPHRAARKCSKAAMELCLQAAVEAGAPEGAMQFIAKADKRFLQAVMAHRDLALIVATGTGSVVRMAQESGKPAIGVGPGNVPAWIHRSADVPAAVDAIMESKTFDNGTVCASEQALVVTQDIAPEVRELLAARGAAFCPADKLDALGAACFDSDAMAMRAEVVGREAAAVAARIEWAVPAGTRLLVAPLERVGADVPLCHEILGPVLALYEVADDAAALATCNALLARGGVGHTASLFTGDPAMIRDVALRMPAGRVLINQPATQGALGAFTNALRPSLTLSAGVRAGNMFLDNITLEHFMEVRRVALPEPGNRWQAIGGDALATATGDASISPAEARQRIDEG